MKAVLAGHWPLQLARCTLLPSVAHWWQSVPCNLLNNLINSRLSIRLCPVFQVRRKMEDENRKARRIARREYLENVRELVAFVKKRDKRVAKAQVQAAAE